MHSIPLSRRASPASTPSQRVVKHSGNKMPRAPTSEETSLPVTTLSSSSSEDVRVPKTGAPALEGTSAPVTTTAKTSYYDPAEWISSSNVSPSSEETSAPVTTTASSWSDKFSTPSIADLLPPVERAAAKERVEALIKDCGANRRRKTATIANAESTISSNETGCC